MVYVYKFCYRIWTDSVVIGMLDISCITYIMIEVLCICPTQALFEILLGLTICW